MLDAVTVASIDGASTSAAAEATGASPTNGVQTTTGFGDRLAERVAERESQIVLGLDPDPAHLWPEALEALDRPPAEQSPAEESPAGQPHSPPAPASRAHEARADSA